jgi:hypothetical protein
MKSERTLDRDSASLPATGREHPPSLLAKMRSSALALVTANLVPLYGVLALKWKVPPIMIFYWTENLVVGFFNVLKMSRAQGPVGDSRMTLNGKPVTQDSRKSLIFFFIAHYGAFTLGHGLFVITIFSPGVKNLFPQLGLALLVLSASHGFSYRRNFIGRGEYLRVSFARLFWQPYVRVVTMHITILAGGTMTAAMGSPIGALLVLVGLKTMIDLGAHWLERRKFSKEPHA